MANLKSKLVAIGVVALLLGMGAVVYLLFTGATPSPVCDHLAKLPDADANAVTDAIVAKAGKSEGTTRDARCRSAWRALDNTLDEKDADRLLACLVHANDATTARSCLIAR